MEKEKVVILIKALIERNTSLIKIDTTNQSSIIAFDNDRLDKIKCFAGDLFMVRREYGNYVEEQYLPYENIVQITGRFSS